MRNDPAARAAISTLHVSCDLILDLLRASQGPLNVIDTLIRAGVVQANIAAATGELDAQLLYGDLDAIPPDAMRRPVSISRLAQGLRLPFETVRRHVKSLCDRGFCEMHRRGVMVPAAYFEQQQSKVAVAAVNAMTAQTFHRLAAGGFFEARALPEPSGQPAMSPPRAVTRLVTDYSLRAAEMLREAWSDNLTALLLMQMMRMNATDGAAFDQPVTASRMAEEVDMKLETARRRLVRLAEVGLCKQTGDGYVVFEGTFAPFSSEALQTNEMNLWRLYRNCALVGAVEAWRAEGGPSTADAPDQADSAEGGRGLRESGS
ncbi:hypothetical protein [Phenylobacterium sp.]|uniref:hypothetical protein n=1 Tax=Phenylobacterium sp. TaxID=1871053 RepID=UPI0035AE55B5